MQAIVINFSDMDNWEDVHQPEPQGWRPQGLLMPSKARPSLVHPTREAAEQEAVRLLLQQGESDGRFAVFELVGVLGAKELTATVATLPSAVAAGIVPVWQERLEI